MPPLVDSKMPHAKLHFLYSDHHSWLYTWIRKRLDNHFDAADLAQDTFLRIHSRHNIDKIKEPRPYLATVAKGIISHFYRRKSLEQSYLNYLSTMPDAAASSDEYRLILLQTLEQVDILLDAMPSHIKKVFLMHQLEGMKYKEIADEMGISLISAKRYMKQALIQCLSIMEDDILETT
ncbi:sigma-70 family RNA polymerase sigma factor [Marinomonas aquiplantarum]|uniref:RNA polymerase sigma-70 factor (ECF subfamily) n=1 Tax=Marinomonas aquiplantarum TaxID=491951 RepID=A0A366D3Z5_9GAMM|nr:sigma-70 family RNA polymerase sigma factor [Marinomonas aquiplantarum]RBO84666.1 RNA polymerase sigma-70 factor (ECF subfamily) [Marinomonas aquiplantarum]